VSVLTPSAVKRNGAAARRSRETRPDHFDSALNSQALGRTKAVEIIQSSTVTAIRDHRGQRSICRRCSRGFGARSTGVSAENFTISDVTGEMTGHGTSPRKCDLSVLLPA
jgi:hypothetical protein